MKKPLPKPTTSFVIICNTGICVMFSDHWILIGAVLILKCVTLAA